MLLDVVKYFKETWQTDKRLFYSEAFGTFLGMLAAVVLNLNPAAPPMLFILHCYLISAVLIFYSSYRRKSSFMMMLMMFYGLTSIYGIYNLCT